MLKALPKVGPLQPGGFIIYGKYVLKSGQIDHHSHAHKLQEIDQHNDPIDRVLVRAVLTLAS